MRTVGDLCREVLQLQEAAADATTRMRQAQVKLDMAMRDNGCDLQDGQAVAVGEWVVTSDGCFPTVHDIPGVHPYAPIYRTLEERTDARNQSQKV